MEGRGLFYTHVFLNICTLYVSKYPSQTMYSHYQENYCMQRLSITKFERPILAVMMVFIYIFNYQTAGIGNTLTNLLIILFIGIEFMVILDNRGTMLTTKALNSYFFFVASCTLSVLYSSAPNDSLGKVKTLFVLLFFLFALMEFMRNEQNFHFMLITISVCAIISSFYLLCKSDWQNGARMDGVIGDSNQVGAYLSYSLVVIMYCWKKKLLSAFICWLGIVLMVIMSLLSGSRSSLMVTVIGLSLFFILTIKKNRYRILKIIAIIGGGLSLLILLFRLVMTNELLYQIIGRRFESFFEIMDSGTSSINENSTQERSLMLQLAFSKFINSPRTIFFGNGIAYFNSFYYEISGHYCFCHNNYMELLSGIGIFGAFFYYYPYFLTAFTAFKSIRTKYALESISILILLLQLFLMHIFVVFYYQKLEFVFISLILYTFRLLITNHSELQSEPSIIEPVER